MKERRKKLAHMLLGCVVFLSCSDGSNDSGSSVMNEPSFTHKMMRQVPGQLPFAQFAYECSGCTFEQWLEIEPAAGWTKGPAQVAVMSRGTIRSTPSLEKVQEVWPNLQKEDFYDSWDFLDEIPGNEYELIAVNIRLVQVIEISPSQIIVTEVMRDTALTFDAGTRVHELTNGAGEIFVLFAYGVDPENVAIPDFLDPEALGDFTPPDGWTYSTRVLKEELVLDSEDTTTVLAIRPSNGPDSTWEKR